MKNDWGWGVLTAIAWAGVVALKLIDATADHADSLKNCGTMCGSQPVRFVESAHHQRGECVCFETDGGR